MPTGKLRFEIPGFEDEVAGPFEAPVSLRVDVFDADFNLVARARSGDTVDLEEGTYSVAATMPDGTRTTDLVAVAAEIESAARLEWVKPVKPRAVSKAYQRTTSKAALGKAPVRIAIRCVVAWEVGSWTPLDEPPTMEVLNAEGSVQDLFASVMIRLQPGDLTERVRFVQIDAPGMERTSVALPVAHATDARACRLDVAISPSHLETDFRLLGSPEAELTARLMESHQIDEAASFEVLEQLLEGKRRDPIGATLAAIALYRRGELDSRLSEWIDNLVNWFPWIPDGHVIQSAQRARYRDARGALESAAHAVDAGPTLVSYSGSILDATLRGLARGKTYKFIEEVDLDRAMELLERHGNWFRQVDVGELMTTIRTSSSPAEPGAGWRQFSIPQEVVDPSSYWSDIR